VKLNREQFLAAAMMIGALNAAACKQSSSSSSPEGTKDTAGAETAPQATAEGAPPPAAEGGPVPTAEGPARPIPTAEGPQIPGVAVLPLPQPLATAVPAASAVSKEAVRRMQGVLDPSLAPIPVPGR
jgi:hypothetical protein